MNSVPSGLWEWMSILHSGERTGMIVLAIFALVFMSSVFLATVYRMHKNRLEDSLKRELLDRGMSADEIATVISSKPMRSGTVDPNHI